MYQGTRHAGRNGSVAVETALSLSIFFILLFMASDMYRIGIERTRLEGTASSLALNLAAQPELTKVGLDALAEIAMQGHEGEQQLIMLSVMQSGLVKWQLERGDATNLCEVEVEDSYYMGELPEDPPESESETDSSTASMIVVRACRNTGYITSYGGITMPEVLQVDSIYRANSLEIPLDEELEKENLITED